MSYKLVVISCGLLLGSCTLERELPPPTAGPLDSTLRAAGLTTGKVKFSGPVTLQIGGINNTASATTVAKAKAPIAAAPAAVATDASKKGGTPWQVFAVLGVLCLAGGIWLGSKFL